jgi:uncharacterized protein YndB with AHSA1/START domain
MDDTDLGTLTRQGDRWTLTFTRRLAHPREKVWRAVTEPEHLAAWYPQEIVGERRAGAPPRFVTSRDDGFDGQMLVFDPPEVMEFTWGTDRLRIELRADGAGTVLTLTDTFGELGKAARDAAGWHECLERLAAGLDGAPPRPWGGRWREVHLRYVTHLGPDAAKIGPPPASGKLQPAASHHDALPHQAARKAPNRPIPDLVLTGSMLHRPAWRPTRREEHGTRGA